MAIPIANVQIYEKVLLSALMANRRRCLPTSDGFHTLATLFRLPPHLEKEITESQIGHLSSPKPFHTRKIQVLKETDVKLADKFKSEFPVMVFALSLNFAMSSRIVMTRTLAVATTFYLSRQLPICLLYGFRRLLIELRRLVFRAIRTSQKSLVAIIEPCSITRLGFRFKPFVISENLGYTFAEAVARF